MKTQGVTGMGPHMAQPARRIRDALARWSLAICVTGALSACSTTPSNQAQPQKIDLGVALEEAAAARKQGNTAQALSLLNEAAQAHPADKAPWLHIAQMRFEQGDYGAAISAAQEVVQRDSQDTVARSIMAVSGLRVSATALAHLRQANAVSGSTRSEAEAIAKTIRESLGENVLVPPPIAGAKPATAPRRARPAATSSTATASPPVPATAPVAAITPTAPPIAVPAPPKAKPAEPVARNPLDALK